MMRSIFRAAVLVWFAVIAPETVGAEESRPALAPPGPCAEPRTAAGPGGVGDDFIVAGPIASLFDPLDVAAGPTGSGLQRQAPPDARTLVRPGSCDRPGSGCGAALRRGPRPRGRVPPRRLASAPRALIAEAGSPQWRHAAALDGEDGRWLRPWPGSGFRCFPIALERYFARVFALIQRRVDPELRAS
jgi:hypothetical protein